MWTSITYQVGGIRMEPAKVGNIGVAATQGSPDQINSTRILETPQKVPPYSAVTKFDYQSETNPIHLYWLRHFHVRIDGREPATEFRRR
ncbi:hypothetical protein PDE_03423 [Penicillium oxalicum 114-2]|uniref:Uncharacterized protein n=1 Tax=Penicillium oxalicum (strain 114-2 / CGMCC 5302) TaxID=933388 RepID=S8B252_PENO1|nr:hypothetical protein PDE_03423 [Penicillium oxalicum 114-2]